MTIDFIYQRHISGCNRVSDKVKSQERTVQSLNNSCLVSHGKLKRIFIYEEKKTVLFSFHMALIQVALHMVYNDCQLLKIQFYGLSYRNDFLQLSNLVLPYL